MFFFSFSFYLKLSGKLVEKRAVKVLTTERAVVDGSEDSEFAFGEGADGRLERLLAHVDKGNQARRFSRRRKVLLVDAIRQGNCIKATQQQ